MYYEVFGWQDFLILSDPGFMTYLLLESIFFGFAVFILLTGLLLPLATQKTKAYLIQLTHSAILLIRIAGIFYLLYWGISVLLTFTYTPGSDDYHVLTNRMFGPYRAWYWITVITFGMSQLFWTRFAQNSWWTRILYALFLLVVLSIQKITVLLASFHRDFVPGGWRQVFAIEFLSSPWLLQLGIFVLFLLITHVLKRKLFLFSKSKTTLE